MIVLNRLNSHTHRRSCFSLYYGSISQTNMNMINIPLPSSKHCTVQSLSHIIALFLSVSLRFVSCLLEEPEVSVVGAGRGPAGSIIHKLFVSSQRVKRHTHRDLHPIDMFYHNCELDSLFS